MLWEIRNLGLWNLWEQFYERWYIEVLVFYLAACSYWVNLAKSLRHELIQLNKPVHLNHPINALLNTVKTSTNNISIIRERLLVHHLGFILEIRVRLDHNLHDLSQYFWCLLVLSLNNFCIDLDNQFCNLWDAKRSELLQQGLQFT